MSSHGTKVTNDPASAVKYEKTGLITSDSLAAESLSHGGSFGAGSHAAASAQPSASSTAANTDISGATVLASAPDAESRMAQSEWSEQEQLNAGKGLGKAAGRGPTYNTPADERNAALRSGEHVGHAYDTAHGHANAAPAPTYVHHDGGVGKPKGKNIHEGGFDSDAPNASFNQDIGGKSDPGRLAEKGMQLHTAESGAGSGPRQKKVTGEGQFDVLGDASA
ncbi:hypothetical protein BJ546DRAFT_967370 [Cryomyces antarcticus]